MTFYKDLFNVLKCYERAQESPVHKDQSEPDVPRLVSRRRGFSERREGCPYTKAYSTDEFKQLLQKHNFDNIKAGVFYNTFDIPEYKRKIKFELDDNVELGWHIAFKAKKS